MGGRRRSNRPGSAWRVWSARMPKCWARRRSTRLARSIYQQQLAQISAALLQVRSRFADRADWPVVAMGSGAFMAVEAGRRLGLTVLDLGSSVGTRSLGGRAVCRSRALLAEQIEARA